jgi:hypothetical protein
MHARIAPTPIPDLIRRVVANPFLPVARRELVHPIGGVRRGGSRSREGVDGRDVAAIFFFFSPAESENGAWSAEEEAFLAGESCRWTHWFPMTG